MNRPITYNARIGKQKPHSHLQETCPFCHIDTLEHVLDVKDDMVWLMNRFPVFENTWPTVIIESADHHGDITSYSRDKMRSVISFCLEKWQETERRGEFKSVIYFRNFGPASGGSQRHPHSQIIGLRDYDYRDNIFRENFMGTVVHENADCYVSVSDYPLCGMGEINVTLKPHGNASALADAIQTAARYVLHDFPIPCDSYNLFFYHMKHIRVKIFPRYITSPLYMGYRITQVFNEDGRRHMTEDLMSPSYFGGES